MLNLWESQNSDLAAPEMVCFFFFKKSLFVALLRFYLTNRNKGVTYQENSISKHFSKQISKNRYCLSC